MEKSGQLHTVAALPLGKEPPVPISEGVGWDPELFWTLQRKEKSLATLTIHPIAHHYTN
jgi:hypothetical protein